MSEKEHRDWDLNSKGEEYLNTFTKEQRLIITNIVLTTMSACSELAGQNIMFTEDIGLKLFVHIVLGHMLEDEYYDILMNHVVVIDDSLGVNIYYKGNKVEYDDVIKNKWVYVNRLNRIVMICIKQKR